MDENYIIERMNIMKIEEINARIAELQSHIEILKELREDVIETNKCNEYVLALDDGIQYTQMRLDEYRSSDWVMMNDGVNKRERKTQIEM